MLSFKCIEWYKAMSKLLWYQVVMFICFVCRLFGYICCTATPFSYPDLLNILKTHPNRTNEPERGPGKKEERKEWLEILIKIRPESLLCVTSYVYPLHDFLYFLSSSSCFFYHSFLLSFPPSSHFLNLSWHILIATEMAFNEDVWEKTLNTKVTTLFTTNIYTNRICSNMCHPFAQTHLTLLHLREHHIDLKNKTFYTAPLLFWLARETKWGRNTQMHTHMHIAHVQCTVLSLLSAGQQRENEQVGEWQAKW